MRNKRVFGYLLLVLLMVPRWQISSLTNLCSGVKPSLVKTPLCDGSNEIWTNPFDDDVRNRAINNSLLLIIIMKEIKCGNSCRFVKNGAVLFCCKQSQLYRNVVEWIFLRPTWPLFRWTWLSTHCILRCPRESAHLPVHHGGRAGPCAPRAGPASACGLKGAGCRCKQPANYGILVKWRNQHKLSHSIMIWEMNSQPKWPN